MIDSIFVALSGMRGHERGLNVISNNVTNMNTPGFRGSTITFSDVFTSGARGGLPDGRLVGRQGSGGGLEVSRPRLDMRNGEVQQTGGDLDLSLDGAGFFVLQEENGEIRYTRAGRFDFVDDELIAVGQKAKSKVMSRNADGQLVPITLQDLRVNPAKATTEVTFNQLLSFDTAEKTLDSVTVFDKAGGKHTLKLVFARTGTRPIFDWNLTVFEGDIEIGSGILETRGADLPPDSSVLQLTLALQGTDPAQIAFDFDAVQFSTFGDNTNLAVQKQDGFTAGTITTRTFDEKGVLKLTYSNGQRADGARLVLAQISDEAGLVQRGNASFEYLGTEPVGLREPDNDLTVRSQSLELSNVELTQQFSELILMQRGYQASSQVTSTANDMLQELLQMRGGR